MKKDEIAIPADPSDPEDGDVTFEGLERSQMARLIRTARTRLELSQPEFARRFHVPIGTLRGWEQARTTAPDFAVAYVRVIRRDPTWWPRPSAKTTGPASRRTSTACVLQGVSARPPRSTRKRTVWDLASCPMSRLCTASSMPLR